MDRVLARGQARWPPESGSRLLLAAVGALLTLVTLRQRRRRTELVVEAAPGAQKPTPIGGAPRPTPRTPRWTAVLASTAALTAYLALLGGSLLAIRFWHAGLPVIQAVSAVPVATLVTTALVQVFFPLLVFTAAWLVVGLTALPGRGHTSEGGGRSPDKVNRWLDRLGRPIAVLLILGVVPFNVWGATFFFSMMVIIFARVWAPHLLRHRAMNGPRAPAVAIAILLGAASIPVLARQAVEPLNMERVTIERPGQPNLIADLVAVRDTSVVVGRCRELYVLPTPASMRIEHLPPGWSSGTSIFEKLGIGSNRPIKPRPMPC
jgi:lysylphosphatidylglycerol synthetase-like protein (DUF2156 family)